MSRSFILTRLVNELGYSPDRIEIEHEYTAGRPHTNTNRIDIIVRDSLSIFNPSGGTAQSGRCHCSISAERLLNFAGRGDLARRRTQQKEMIKECASVMTALE